MLTITIFDRDNAYGAVRERGHCANPQRCAVSVNFFCPPPLGALCRLGGLLLAWLFLGIRNSCGRRRNACTTRKVDENSRVWACRALAVSIMYSCYGRYSTRCCVAVSAGYGGIGESSHHADGAFGVYAVCVTLRNGNVPETPSSA